MARIKYYNSETGNWEYADANSGPNGGVTSWNDLTDKPFHDEVITYILEFDGDITGKESVEIPDMGYVVKMSNKYVPVSEMIGATLVFAAGGMEISLELTTETAVDASYVVGVPGSVALVDSDPALISLPNDATIMGATLSAGTWFACIPDEAYVRKLTCLVEEKTVQKIDNECLPETKNDFGNFTLTAYGDPFQVGKNRLTVLGGDVLEQMDRGIVSIKFDYLNSAGTETKAFTATMLPMGKLEWYGFCREEDVVYMVNMAALDGQNMMLCQVTITPIFVRNGSSANELNPVAFNGFKSYAISVDDNGNVVAKELMVIG